MNVRLSTSACELALADPLAAFESLADIPHAFLLHSSLLDARARWSFFGADPFAVFGPGDYDAAIALWRHLGKERVEVPSERAEGPPFRGGLVGAWAYDFGRRLERLPATARDDVRWPDVWLAAYDVVGAVEHATGRAWIVSSGLPETGEARDRRARARLDAFRRRLERVRGVDPAGRGAATSVRLDPPVPLRARSTFTRATYCAAVERVREHIRCGDIFQANLSQRWTLPLDAESRARAPGANARRLFAALGAESAAPFSACLDLGDCAVASASPERFLEVRGRRVETRPIKGTRPRGTTPEADARERARLLASGKDRAENVMIVDVLRNDLGRVAAAGSVAVPELCSLESFPQVHHLTSTVTGDLREGVDAIDLLHACFPGGSITGAPKIRAMEILEALEPVRRHLYTGAIGWLDWNGDADWNIAIRTAMVLPEAIHFAAGGGITADSDPAAEYEETLAKAEGMRRALAAAGWPVEIGDFADPAAPGDAPHEVPQPAADVPRAAGPVAAETAA